MTTPAQTLDPTEVQVGTPNGPGIYVAPPGTPFPATTFAPWAAPWKVLGYLSEDGPTVGQSTDSTDMTPWQSAVPLRSIITGKSLTLQFVLWQLNELTLGMYFDVEPPAVGTGGVIDMDIRTDEPQKLYAVGIDSADAERVLRLGFYRASLSDAGDMEIQRGAVVPLDCTLSALDDSGRLAKVMLGPAVDPAAARARAREQKADDKSKAA